METLVQTTILGFVRPPVGAPTIRCFQALRVRLYIMGAHGD